MNQQYNSHSDLFARVGPEFDGDQAPSINPGPTPTGAFQIEAGGAVRHLGPASSATATPTADDILGNAVDKNGTPVGRADITKDTILTVRGIQASVSSLLASGLIVKDAQGYAVGQPKAPTTAAPRPVEKTDAMPADDEAVASSISASTSQAAQNQAINDLARDGVVSEQTLKALADEMRCDPGEASAKVSQLVDGFRSQAADALAAFGDPEEIYEFAQKHHPKLLAEAIKTQAGKRSLAGYAEVGRAFISGLDKTANGRAQILGAQLEPGMRARVVSTASRPEGEVLLSYPKWPTEISWSRAVAMKLINPNRS